MQFLHLRLSLNPGLWWSYEKASPKPLLSANSMHLKQIKRSLVISHIHCAMNHSWVHDLSRSLTTVVARIVSAGYRMNLNQSVMINRFSNNKNRSPHKPPNKRVVITFYQASSNYIGLISQQLGIEVVSRNNFRLSRLMTFKKDPEVCTKKPSDPVGKHG